METGSLENRTRDSNTGLLGNWRDVRDHVRRRGARRVVSEVAGEFRRNKLLTYASAMSYQLLFALVPAALAAVAVLGFLDLSSVWQDEVAPEVRERVSSAAFQVLDDTVRRVLGAQQGYWVTLGLAFALWQLSGALRATMGALNDIYSVRDDRTLVRRIAVSLALAAAGAVAGVAAIVMLQVVPRLPAVGEGALGTAATAASWLLAFVLLVLLVGTVLRFAPAAPQSLEWLGFATTVVVVGWLAASAGFAAWSVELVSYGSIYGGFAAVILLMTYVYLLAVVFLAGVQLDALVRTHARERHEGGS